MRVKPGSTHAIWEEWGATGATLGVKLSASDGSDAVARTTGFVEDETGSGVYLLTEFTFPDELGDYQLIFDDNGGDYTDPARVSTRQVTVTSSAPDEDFDGDTYATVDELFRILKIRNPSAEQSAAGERVLVAAAGEINSEIDLADGEALAGWQVALAAEVNLERAVEHWRQQEAPFGLIGLGAEMGGAFASTDTWGRHAHKLAPLKSQWGIA